MRDQMRAVSNAVLSFRPLAGGVRLATRHKLRVLGYHGVDSPAVFDRQMAYVSEHYNVVSADEVEAAMRGTYQLPDFAVWITFDDGLPSVVTNALPILELRDIRATMFVCPGVIDTSEPLWWQLVEICNRDGAWPDYASDLDVKGLIQHFKSVDNATREYEVARLREYYSGCLDSKPVRSQLGTEDLMRLSSAGHTIGNHTWTHPLLDKCDEFEQNEQILMAHQWLERELGFTPRIFAYPNGNTTPRSEQLLRELGYVVAVLFDHRFAETKLNPLRVSRLRTGDENSPQRFAAILAGSHPMLYAARSQRVVPR